MEISLDYGTVNAFKPIFCQSKRVSVSSECVVSDKCQDISRVASLHKEVVLKSKDINGRSVDVTGEVHFTLLYITEDEDKLQWISMSSDFSASFDLPEEISAAQVDVTVQSSECSVLNPRKVSVNAQLSAQLSAYVNTAERIECGDADTKGLHILKQCGEKTVCASVCEKTFIISEQRVPEAAPVNAVISHTEVFTVNEKQVIGTKAIIKGTARMELLLDCGRSCPVLKELSLPFSQIIETGAEDIYDFTAAILPNAVYVEAVDTINGEQAVDIEIHALTQLCAYRKQSVNYAADAYSNLNEISFEKKSETYILRDKTRTESVKCRGALEAGTDIKAVAYTHSEISSVSIQENSAKVTVCIDIVYSTDSDCYSSVRRYVEAEGELPGRGKIAGCGIEELNINEDGKNLEYELSVNMELEDERAEEVSYIEKISLSDEPKDRTVLPSLFLVRGESRSVWELAKRYNSTVERIEALNTAEDIKNGKMLMIAKSI